MTNAVLQNLGQLSTYRHGVDTYDPAKLGLGKLIFQYNGGTNETRFAGPAPVGLARPMEQTTAIASQFPWAMQWQNNTAGEIDWVFLADLATAAATRRINCYTYNRRTSTFTWRGFVTVTFPGTSEAKTVRAMRMTYDKHTAGTAVASGTAVTGTSTTWQADKACVGNRMGWPTVAGDASTVPTWYEISAIASDTGITLATSAGSQSGNYIIEDLRCAMVVTSVTTNLGGLYLCKGLNFDQFSSVGGTVPAAVSTDNIRASYFLKDAVTGTALVAFGAGISPKTTFSSQMMYFLETLANPVVFKFNIRAALTVSSGADTTAFQYKTGSGGAVTGTPTQLNNGRLATMASGPASGVEALYFTTASRVYCAKTSDITTGSTTWLSSGYVMTEVPPGGVNSTAASGAMSAVEYADSIDKLLIVTGATQRNYATQFRTDNGQLDRLWGVNNLQIDQSTSDSNLTPVPSQTGGSYTVWAEAGMCYLAIAGTTAIINRLYAVPFGADWEYYATTNSHLVLPAMSTPGATKFVAAFAQEKQVLGSSTDALRNLGITPEAFKIGYRTSGITDDSVEFTDLDDSGLINAAGANSIQLSIKFRTIGTMSMIPSRILSAGVLYDAGSMSAYWQGSSNIGTDLANKRFGFRHAVAYGGTVPRLKVALFDAESGASLGTDDTTTAAWTWEKSTNAGGAWGAMNMADRANADTYVRVTPTSLADNIKVRAELQEY